MCLGMFGQLWQLKNREGPGEVRSPPFKIGLFKGESSQNSDLNFAYPPEVQQILYIAPEKLTSQ